MSSRPSTSSATIDAATSAEIASPVPTSTTKVKTASPTHTTVNEMRGTRRTEMACLAPSFAIAFWSSEVMTSERIASE